MNKNKMVKIKKLLLNFNFSDFLLFVITIFVMISLSGCVAKNSNFSPIENSLVPEDFKILTDPKKDVKITKLKVEADQIGDDAYVFTKHELNKIHEALRTRDLLIDLQQEQIRFYVNEIKLLRERCLH